MIFFGIKERKEANDIHNSCYPTRHTTLPAACSCNISIKLLCLLLFPCLRLPQTNAGIIIRTVDPNFLSHARKHPWIGQRDRQTSPHGEAVPFQNNIFGSTCWAARRGRGLAAIQLALVFGARFCPRELGQPLQEALPYIYMHFVVFSF